MSEHKVLLGAIWTEFDETKGSMPSAWAPETLSDEILFSVSLRGMSVFSSRPTGMSYSKMITTIPFPEYEFYSVSTVLYEASEQNRGGFSINLVSILIPAVLMEMAWIDLRQIQAVFQKYFEGYQGEPVPHKDGLIREVAYTVDLVLERKLQVINEGEKIRDYFSNYLDSYFVTSLGEEEKHLIQARVRTLIILLDRVLEAGDHERIQRALDKMNFILEQELSDEVVGMYQQVLSQLIQTR